MANGRWTNPSQPQTLVIAVFLLYIHAAFGVLDVFRVGRVIDLSPVGLVYYIIVIGGGILAGYGISNERKWSYLLGLGVALAPFGLSFYLVGNPFQADLITLIFEIALVALLLHTQSREYQRIWFK